MFLLFPKRVRFVTALTPKQCRERLNRELTEYTRRPSLVAASSFIKAHRYESCYFGSCAKKEGGEVCAEIFYHRAKKHDGSSAGFFGTITKRTDGEKGAVIEGQIRRTVSAMAAMLTWAFVTLVFSFLLFILKEYTGAAVAAGVMAAGLALMSYDRSESYIRSYLEGFENAEGS